MQCARLSDVRAHPRDLVLGLGELPAAGPEGVHYILQVLLLIYILLK